LWGIKVSGLAPKTDLYNATVVSAMRRAENSRRARETAARAFSASLLIFEKKPDGTGQRLRVARRNRDTGFAVHRDFRPARVNFRINDRQSGGHGFNLHQTKRFRAGYRGKNEHLSGFVIRKRVFDVTQQMNLVSHAMLPDGRSQFLLEWPSADKQKVCVDLFYCRQQKFEPFVRNEAAHSEKNARAVLCPNFGNFGGSVRTQSIHVDTEWHDMALVTEGDQLFGAFQVGSGGNNNRLGALHYAADRSTDQPAEKPAPENVGVMSDNEFAGVTAEQISLSGPRVG
jgi:hypothetical protein